MKKLGSKLALHRLTMKQLARQTGGLVGSRYANCSNSCQACTIDCYSNGCPGEWSNDC